MIISANDPQPCLASTETVEELFPGRLLADGANPGQEFAIQRLAGLGGSFVDGNDADWFAPLAKGGETTLLRNGITTESAGHPGKNRQLGHRRAG